MAKHGIITGILWIAFIGAFAQVDRGGEPVSWNINQSISYQTIWQTLPSVNALTLLTEDALTFNDKSQSLRFATSLEANFTTDTHGKWTNLHNGDRIWMLGIESTNAYSLGVTFNSIVIPEGGRLYVYSENKEDFIGPLTIEDNREDNLTTLPPIAGSKIIIEYYEPYAFRGDGTISLSSVAHGYRNLRDADILNSYSCLEQVMITPNNKPLQNASSSVLMMITDDGQRIATAALINNSKNDGTPYVITANAALQGNPSSWVFLFDVAGQNCFSSSSICWSRAVCGAQVIEADESHGTALLKLKAFPKSNWTAYYSGWANVEPAPFDALYAVQSSLGLPQSYSTYQGDISIEQWHGMTVYAIEGWEFGNSFKGALGSPLFDENNNIIGVYLGGDGTCEDSQTEYFAAIKASWTEFRTFLDPLLNSGPRLEGFYPIIPESEQSTAAGDISFFPNPARNWIYIQNKSNNPILKIEILDACGRKVMEGSPITPTLDISNLPLGMYAIRFYREGSISQQKLLLR